MQADWADTMVQGLVSSAVDAQQGSCMGLVGQWLPAMHCLLHWLFAYGVLQVLPVLPMLLLPPASGACLYLICEFGSMLWTGLVCSGQDK